MAIFRIAELNIQRSISGKSRLKRNIIERRAGEVIVLTLEKKKITSSNFIIRVLHMPRSAG